MSGIGERVARVAGYHAVKIVAAGFVRIEASCPCGWRWSYSGRLGHPEDRIPPFGQIAATHVRTGR